MTSKRCIALVLSAAPTMVLPFGLHSPLAQAAHPQYVWTDLGDLPGGEDRSHAYGINDFGQVIGGSRMRPNENYTLEHPFLWTPTTPNGMAGAMVDLGIPTATFGSGQATSINDRGQVTFRVWGANEGGAALWTPTVPNAATGSMIVLPSPPGPYQTHTASSLNNVGQVVGTHFMNTAPEAFVWSPDTPNGSAGTSSALTPGAPSRATDVNAIGQVVGNFNGVEDRRGFLFTPAAPNAPGGSVTYLDVPDGYDVVRPMAINDSGHITGWVIDFDFGERPFVWTPATPNGGAGQMTILDDVDSQSRATANDINSAGVIVGEFSSSIPSSHSAFIWNASDGAQALSALLETPLPAGWELMDAVAINDRGQIAAQGILIDPDYGTRPIYHAFLLTPAVPEPGVAAGILIACVTAVCRRPGVRGTISDTND
jgi:uncharacterized membrane protein